MVRKYKTRIKYFMNTKNIKINHLILLCVAIMFFTTGFSYLSTALTINGTVTYSLQVDGILDTHVNLEFKKSPYMANIKTITFNNSINTPGDAVASWDVSADSSGSIIAYVKTNTDNSSLYDLFIEANGTIYANENCQYLFGGMTNLTTINNINLFNTSNTTNMSYLFGSCSSLVSLDLSSFDTSSAVNMSRMFDQCTSLSSLNIIGFDYTNVENLSGMFFSCKALPEIDFFDSNNNNIYSAVTDMSDLFCGCEKLTSIGFYNFDTSNVTTFKGMFIRCKVIEYLDLDIYDFDTSSATDLGSMFASCNSLKNIDVSKFVTSSVTVMSYMFSGCTSLTSLSLLNFDTSNVTSMTGMFSSVTCSINIPATTGSISNTTTRYYGSSTSVYAEGTFILSGSLDLFISRAKAGNATSADVGTIFTVDLGSTYGTHTLRVANVTTASDCSTEGFSQTACGVVLEFADIITTHNMNSTSTNVGGWPVTSMRTFINNDIYNALPSNVKSAIIETSVVSGHGSTSGETNFTSTDKLYLLSAHEVWTDGISDQVSSYDTSYNNTRQLDYYAGLNVTTSSYSGAIKYNGSTASWWWLRSAASDSAGHFLDVDTGGDWNSYRATITGGVSPAFRIA